jgi:hypothetical protein
MSLQKVVIPGKRKTNAFASSLKKLPRVSNMERMDSPLRPTRPETNAPNIHTKV